MLLGYFKMCISEMFLQFCCVVGRHNLIILWGDRAIYPEKGLLDPTYQEKGFFILNLQHNWRIISYHLQFPLGRLLVCTEGQACYWPDIDLCLVEKEKAKKASDPHFLLRFVWIHQLGLGVTWDWNQRKNFHFHIPNRFHIKPLFCKTLPTYNCNPPTRNFTLSRPQEVEQNFTRSRVFAAIWTHVHIGRVYEGFNASGALRL